MKNEKLLLQANDILVPANRRIMQNLECFLPKTPLRKILSKKNPLHLFLPMKYT